ncbi:MAG TPA: peptide-methionine (S)-S-oxide reductase MsrA [Stenomitos sp.]
MRRWGAMVNFKPIRWMMALVLGLWVFAQPCGMAIAAPLAKAAFAGGCFWCMEKPFDQLPGVVSTTSGYTGGHTVNPTYRQVSAGATGHAESVEVVYDPTQVSYDTLLDVFWHNVDPLDTGGQFCDRGSQYRTNIFVYDEQQRQQAEASKQALEQSGLGHIATEIQPAQTFYAAEDYHQNYYQTHPVQYRFYRFTCGRDQRLAEVWGSTAVAQEPSLP